MDIYSEKILIIHHSQSGNTEAMAKAVSEGANIVNAPVVLKRDVYTNSEDILGCDIMAISTLIYIGYMAGLVKDFFDRV